MGNLSRYANVKDAEYVNVKHKSACNSVAGVPRQPVGDPVGDFDEREEAAALYPLPKCPLTTLISTRRAVPSLFGA